jgi:hypothetical protein
MIFPSTTILRVLDWIALRFGIDFGLDEDGIVESLDEREVSEQLPRLTSQPSARIQDPSRKIQGRPPTRVRKSAGEGGWCLHLVYCYLASGRGAGGKPVELYTWRSSLELALRA